jgi:hypothetical protein
MAQLDLTPFLRTIRKARIGLTVLAALSLPMGVLLFFLEDSSMSNAANLAMQLGLGGFFLVLGGYLGFLAFRSPTKDKGIRTLLERQSDIVWISPVRNLTNGNHVATRYNLNLVDGTTQHVAVVPGDEELAEKMLRAHCPTARFGFRREWEQQFKADPASMSAGRGTPT